MDKVIQIANICKDMCNVPNPIPGRIYYAKGCAPALNTCGGGVEKTDVFMDKAKVTTPPPPTALCARTHQRQRQRAGQPHIILSRQPILRMCHRQQIHKPRNMDNRTIKLTNLIQIYLRLCLVKAIPSPIPRHTTTALKPTAYGFLRCSSSSAPTRRELRNLRTLRCGAICFSHRGMTDAQIRLIPARHQI